MTPYVRPAWIADLAADLARTTTDLRRTLRRQHHDPQPEASTRAGRTDPRGIRISLAEARTLLRGALPVPLYRRPRRAAHATLTVALARCADALLDCNDDPRMAGPHAITAVLDCADALRAWAQVARWQQATQAAHLAWSIGDKVASATTAAPSPEQTAHAAPPETDRPEPPARTARAPRRRAVQRALLLPIATTASSHHPAEEHTRDADADRAAA